MDEHYKFLPLLVFAYNNSTGVFVLINIQYLVSILTAITRLLRFAPTTAENDQENFLFANCTVLQVLLFIEIKGCPL